MKPPLLRALLFCILVSGFAPAQNTRSWVSASGSDSNPCTRNQPCLTFSHAITQTNAGGEVDAVDAGGFDGVTITKAITIDGGGGTIASALAGSGNAIVVQAGTSDVVTLRHLRIDGNGTAANGIRFTSGKVLHIENCVIFGFTNNGIDISLSAAAQVTVENTIAKDNGAVGLRAVGAGAIVSVNVRGSSFPANGFGLWADTNSRVTVTNSDASGNIFLGFIAQAASTSSTGSAVLNLANSNASNNGIGVQSGGGPGLSTVNLDANTLFDNSTSGIVVGANGTMNTYVNNANTGNGTPNGQHLAFQ